MVEVANKSRGGGRRADIQGLRALAVVFVVLFHAGLPFPGGFVGVDVFFVISGFVITAMLMREHATHGRIRFGRFYLRRFKRLTPALAVMVAVTMVVSVPLLSPLGGHAAASQTGIGAMLLGANLVISRSTGDYFSRPAEGNPLLNTWSLSVEEQFYLVFPLLLSVGWLIARGRTKRAWVPAAVVATVAALSWVATMVDFSALRASWPLLSTLFGFYGPIPRAWEFAVGALLAMVVARWPLTSPRWGMLAGIVGALLTVSSLWLITGETPFPGPWTWLPVVGTLLLLVAGSGNTNAIGSLLSTRPMVALGDWSYSIYLWHWPFIVWARLMWPHNTYAMVAAALVSFIPAYASYRWVEQPIRLSNSPNKRSVVRLVAATVLPPLLISGAVGFASQRSFWSPKVAAFREVGAFHLGYRTNCSGWKPADAERCTLNRDATGRPIYLVGDSNADQFAEALEISGSALHRPVQLMSFDGCRFYEGWQEYSDVSFGKVCNGYGREAAAWLESAPKGTVIISQIDVAWVDPARRVGTSEANASTDTAVKLGYLRETLAHSIDRMRAAGHEVLVVQTLPRWGANAADSIPTECMLAHVAFGSCQRTMTMADVLKRQGAQRAIVAEVAAAHGAHLLDLWDQMCSEGVCPSHADGMFKYRDATHISVAQSKALAPAFEDILRKISDDTQR